MRTDNWKRQMKQNGDRKFVASTIMKFPQWKGKELSKIEE